MKQYRHRNDLCYLFWWIKLLKKVLSALKLLFAEILLDFLPLDPDMDSALGIRIKSHVDLRSALYVRTT